MIKSEKEGKVLPFYLEGQFIGFLDEFKPKPKRIRVATAQGERLIKLAKELRYSMYEVLQPGDWVEILGEQKLKYKTGQLKLKAYHLNVKAPQMRQVGPGGDGQSRKISSTHPLPLSPSPSPINTPPSTASKTKACVMVCQKSSCRQRGADQVCQSINESLCDRGLEDQVAIKGTGCMKQCKQGPCVVFMPDKSRYTRVSPNEINQLVEKHFAAKLKPEESKLPLFPVP